MHNQEQQNPQGSNTIRRNRRVLLLSFSYLVQEIHCLPFLS